MEGPEIAGPKVWIDLNKKCEVKIINFINKNKVRLSREMCKNCVLITTGEVWMAQKVPGGL